MPNVFVVYPPGSGGNHIKNLMCLSGSFINSGELDPAVYDATDRAPGEVWCVGGRNLQEIFFQRILANSGSSSVLTAHFGELLAAQDWVRQVPDIRLIIITMKHGSSRRALETRQARLGQHCHPYWLDEELVFCYQHQMYEKYLGIAPHHCIEIELEDFWHNHGSFPKVLAAIEQFLSITIPRDSACELHSKWIMHNFAPSSN